MVSKLKIRKLRNRKEKNAIIVALYLFQYSLLIPFRALIPLTILVGVSSAFLVFTSLWINRHKVFLVGPFFSFLFPLFLLLIKTLVSGTIGSLAVFVSIAGFPMIVFINEFDEDIFIFFSCILAILNFFILILFIPIPENDYMRFGYGMVLTVAVLYIRIFCWDKEIIHQKLIYFLIFLLSAFILVFRGARGATLCFVILFFLDRVLIQRKQLVLNAIIVSMLLIAFFNIREILNYAEKLMQIIGINSRPIMKARMLLEGGFAYASSGRADIYAIAIRNFREHPFWGGELDTSESYAHNLFLQVLDDLGIVGFIPLILVLTAVIVFIFARKYDEKKRIVLLLFFSIGVGRLLFSSTLWKRPEFWMMIYYWVAQVEKKHRFSLGMRNACWIFNRSD